MMTKSTIFVSLLTVVLLFTFVERSSVANAGGFDLTALAVTDDRVASSMAADAAEASDWTQQKRGNGFVRALGAPFRALGRLFGGKKNDQQARRITDKEAAKFESAKVTRTKDSHVEPPSTSTPQVSAAPALTTQLSLSEFDSHLQRGRELLIAGDINTAISELTTATSINPKAAEANNLLGIAYESKGLRDRALKAFELAIKVDGNNAEYLNNLGFLLYKNDYNGRAMKYLKRAAKLSPKDARIWNNLALAQCQHGKFDDAYVSFVKAVGEFGAHVNMAAQLQSRAYAKDAIVHLEQAQAMRPNSVEVLTKLVALYDMTGRPTDAETLRHSLVALKTFADANK
jgi:Flp pilus assembly protein TadD